MWIKANFKKLNGHVKTGGMMYAFWRGIKYFAFLFRRYIPLPKLPVRRSAEKNSVPELRKGKLKVVCYEYGVQIFWDEREISRGVGLNVAVNTLGMWTDSGKGKFTIVEKNDSCMKIRVVFQELPLSQVWDLELKSENELAWQISQEVEEWLRIDEIRILSLIVPWYKSWVSDYQTGYFPRQDDNWHDLYIGKPGESGSMVGVKASVEGIPLPSFILETNGKGLYPLVQNSTIGENSRAAGFRFLYPQDKNYISPGVHHFFSGSVRIFEDESLLENKVESFRQDFLKKTMDDLRRSKPPRRKLKFFLVNLPWHRQGNWGVRAGSRWPHIKDSSEDAYQPFPFFLAYAAALLRKNDIEAVVIDALAEQMSEEVFIEKILAEKFDYLVAETSVPSFYDDMLLLKGLSDVGVRIILCGPNYEIFKPRFLRENPFIDFVITGEYEFTLLELARALQDGGVRSVMPGLNYIDGRELKAGGPREPFDIDLLPWPLRDGLPMEKYLDAPGEMQTPSVQMLASRGCPFMCQFCLWPQVLYRGHHYRVRNVQDVVDEMEYLVRSKGYKSIYFDDDTFNIGKERMLSLCRDIKNRKLDKTQWAIMARPDLMDEQILEAMKSAGLWAVKYGVESACQDLVDKIGKGMDLKKAERMIRLSNKMGIRVHLTFTFGLPGETNKTIDYTIKKALELDPFSVQFSITTPFPGTEYYKILERKHLIVSKNFSHFDGHHKSVISLETLKPEDLERAKLKAYRFWNDRIRKKRGWRGNLERFSRYLKEKGLFYAVCKGIGYFKYVFFKRREYLNPELPAGNEYLGDKGNVCEFPVMPRSRKSDSKEGVYPDNADILFVQCPPWDVSIPPLGVAYLSAYMRKYGYKTAVFDLNVELYNRCEQSIKSLWEQKNYDMWTNPELFRETWDRLKTAASGVIHTVITRVASPVLAISINYASILFVAEILRIIRQTHKEVKIIVGGWGCFDEAMRNRLPKDLIDVFVVGEGEETLREVMEELRGKDGKNNIPGAIFNFREGYTYTPRPPIMNLDDIPWPTYNEFNLNSYTHSYLPLFSSRGCIGKCSFCNDSPCTGPYRSRSARNVFEEITFHMENNLTEGFSFKDLTCNGDMKRLNELCGLIIDSGLEIHWDSQAIPRPEMTYEVLRNMKRAGCDTLIYGMESFSDNVLRGMRKMFNRKIAERVLRDTQMAQIKAFINIIVGFPGETEDDFKETLDFITQNRRNISSIGAISVCLVNNNSDLELRSGNYGLIMSEDYNSRAKKWMTRDGKNTYEVRKRRAEQMLDLVNKLGFTYETVTV